jgi:hypothetical protein
MTKVDQFSRLSYDEESVVRAVLGFANLQRSQLRSRTLNVQHRTIKEVRAAHAWIGKVLDVFASAPQPPKHQSAIHLKVKGKTPAQWSKLEWWLADVRVIPYMRGGKLATDGEVIPLSVGGLCAYAALLIAERRGERKVPRYRIRRCKLAECRAFFDAVSHGGRPLEYCCESHKRKAHGQ